METFVLKVGKFFQWVYIYISINYCAIKSMYQSEVILSHSMAFSNLYKKLRQMLEQLGHLDTAAFIVLVVSFQACCELPPSRVITMG